MAISPKQEEQLVGLETALQGAGARLTAQQIADIGAAELKRSKLKDGLRAAIYIEDLHQRDQNLDWDRLLPVDALMATFREQL